MDSFAMIHFKFPTAHGGFEDISFTKEEWKTNFPSQIGVDDKLQDFIEQRIEHRILMSDENQQKSIQHKSSYGVWLQKILAGSCGRGEPYSWNVGTFEDNKTKWVGLQYMLISEESDERKSLQRYSAYSIWLKKLLERSRTRSADPENSARLEVDESNTKWIDPIDIIAHKTMKHVSAVSKASKSIRSFNAALSLYKSFVRPMVELSLPVTSPYKMTDLAHNSVHAQSEILKSICHSGMRCTPGESTDNGHKLTTEFVLLYKMINGFVNTPGIMNKINAVPALRPLIFHNHLFSHSYRGTKYPEEGVALFILLKVTPHQFTAFQKYCCSQPTDLIDTCDNFQHAPL